MHRFHSRLTIFYSIHHKPSHNNNYGIVLLVKVLISLVTETDCCSQFSEDF